MMGRRCAGRALGGPGLHIDERRDGQALCWANTWRIWIAHHAISSGQGSVAACTATGIGDLAYSFVTRGIDWGKSAGSDTMISSRRTSANFTGRISYVVSSNLNSYLRRPRISKFISFALGRGITRGVWRGRTPRPHSSRGRFLGLAVALVSPHPRHAGNSGVLTTQTYLRDDLSPHRPRL